MGHEMKRRGFFGFVGALAGALSSGRALARSPKRLALRRGTPPKDKGTVQIGNVTGTTAITFGDGSGAPTISFVADPSDMDKPPISIGGPFVNQVDLTVEIDDA
jgi:hypothetical protein